MLIGCESKELIKEVQPQQKAYDVTFKFLKNGHEEWAAPTCQIQYPRSTCNDKVHTLDFGKFDTLSWKVTETELSDKEAKERLKEYINDLQDHFDQDERVIHRLAAELAEAKDSCKEQK